MNPTTLSESEFEVLATTAMDAPQPARAPMETPEAAKALGLSFGSLLGALNPYTSIIVALLEKAGLELAASSLPKLREYVQNIEAKSRWLSWLKNGLLAAIDALLDSPLLADQFFRI